MRLLRDIRAVFENYHLKSGLYHFYRGEWLPAIQFLGRALQAGESLPPSDAAIAREFLTQAHLCEAEEAEAEGDPERAVEALRAAGAAAPSFPDIQARLARALESAGHLEEAIEKYRAACALHPRYIDARQSLGFALLAAGRLGEAAEEFQELFKETIARQGRPYLEGLRALSAGDGSLATRCLREAFCTDRHRLAALQAQAMAHLRSERWHEAAAALAEATGLFPGYADLHNYLGVALAESGRREEAVAAFRASLALNPQYSIAGLNLAYALSAEGPSREAEELLEMLLKAEPGNSAALARLEELRGSRLDPRRLEIRRAPRGSTP